MRLQLVVYQTNVSPYKIRCSVPKKRQYKFCMERFNKALQTLKEDEKQHTLRNIRFARNLCLCTIFMRKEIPYGRSNNAQSSRVIVRPKYENALHSILKKIIL